MSRACVRDRKKRKGSTRISTTCNAYKLNKANVENPLNRIMIIKALPTSKRQTEEENILKQYIPSIYGRVKD